MDPALPLDLLILLHDTYNVGELNLTCKVLIQIINFNKSKTKLYQLYTQNKCVIELSTFNNLHDLYISSILNDYYGDEAISASFMIFNKKGNKFEVNGKIEFILKGNNRYNLTLLMADSNLMTRYLLNDFEHIFDINKIQYIKF